MSEIIYRPPKYSIEVYEDHALIRGKLLASVFTLLVSLCRDEGFTHIISLDKGGLGFKLVKNLKEEEI